ncbi:MAG: hypothetical protein QXM08_03160 [Thermofilaceae archaeon]
MGAMVDVQLWVLAKKRPSPHLFSTSEKYEEALRAHEMARRFFAEEFPRLRVYMSLHQLAELYHALAFRGARVPAEEAAMIVEEIVKSPAVIKVPVTLAHYREAVVESTRTGIHVWDYLCFIPVKGFIDTVYSTDPHFERICREHNVKLVNPTGFWSEHSP